MTARAGLTRHLNAAGRGTAPPSRELLTKPVGGDRWDPADASAALVRSANLLTASELKQAGLTPTAHLSGSSEKTDRQKSASLPRGIISRTLVTPCRRVLRRTGQTSRPTPET